MGPSKYPECPILIVDDEEHLLFSYDTVLRSNGISNIVTCSDSRKVSSLLGEQDFALLLLDLYMPHVAGEEILAQVSRDYPHLPVIIITGVDTVDTAVYCIKNGAFDYMVKPVEEGRLLTSVNRALEFKALRKENVSLKNRILEHQKQIPDSFDAIITRDPGMFSIFKYAAAVAGSPMPVLITGETGTGKELFVECLHNISNPGGKLVKLNVAGLDDHLFSDTLFGHRKGAFTGAEKKREGLVQQAAGGTLFLDEIGDLSVPSQVKLLRLLQNREYYPLGSDETEYADTRVIVATNFTLQALHSSDTFRKDLYYRLQTHHIHIPALKERKGDIPLLVDFFLNQAAEEMNRKKPAVPKELFTLLGTYHFPGNIRELQSMVYDAFSQHQARVLSMEAFKGYLSRIDPLTPEVDSPDPGTDSIFSAFMALPTLKQAEHQLVKEALDRSEGNQSIAAKLLGISRQALNRRVKNMM
ncbi:MAG: sigma-54 dependent transcriptional regulator [Desulfobacterales bacterium]|nr:sigma-54 dependent transcriptional regulator [Desulfobacterales bacterium]